MVNRVKMLAPGLRILKRSDAGAKEPLIASVAAITQPQRSFRNSVAIRDLRFVKQKHPQATLGVVLGENDPLAYGVKDSDLFSAAEEFQGPGQGPVRFVKLDSIRHNSRSIYPSFYHALEAALTARHDLAS
jgi:hypothetical protein